MARKPGTDQLIHCNACGEDYSSTYRRCPFCGERVNARSTSNDDDDYEDDGYVFDGQAYFDDPEGTEEQESASSGGRRLSAPAKRGRFDSTPIANWPRLVTYAFSLVIIIAALVIVFTVFYPMIHSNNDPMGGNTSDPNPGVSDSVPPSDEPSDPVGEPSDDPEPSDPVVEPSTDPGLTSIKLSTYDFTLYENEWHRIGVTLDPEDWAGELVWTSSNEEYATVDSTGKVTNVNKTTSLRRVIITVTAGNISESCTVYCRGVAAAEPSPSTSTEPVDPSEQPSERADLVPGTEGYIVGASGGLRVRSGPGTTYSVQASLVNGNKVTIVEEAENGWYRISYSTSGGTATGYIMGDFIAVR